MVVREQGLLARHSEVTVDRRIMVGAVDKPPSPNSVTRVRFPYFPLSLFLVLLRWFFSTGSPVFFLP